MRRRLSREVVRCMAAAMVLFGLPAVGWTEEDNDDPETEQTSTEDAPRGESDGGDAAVEEAGDDGLSDRELREWRQRRQKARASTDPQNQDWDEYWSWDLAMEVGLARQASRYGIKGDVRTGVVYVPEPYGYALGMVGELSNISDPAVGLEFEMLSMLFGTYGQIGGLVDIDGEFTATVGLGWQLFAFELQYEPSPDMGGNSPWTGMAKLHFPVSWVTRAITGNKPD